MLIHPRATHWYQPIYCISWIDRLEITAREELEEFCKSNYHVTAIQQAVGDLDSAEVRFCYFSYHICDHISSSCLSLSVRRSSVYSAMCVGFSLICICDLFFYIIVGLNILLVLHFFKTNNLN